MDPEVITMLIPIVICTGMFAMVFGIFYLRNRERMAMIERGMNPTKGGEQKKTNPGATLTWGLLLIGSGLGLFLAYILDNTLPFQKNSDNPAIYFSLIALFGGVGLYLAYHIENKNNKKQDSE